MNRDERRRMMDPKLVEKIRARLARMKTNQAARQTEELAAAWEKLPPNWIERQLLAAKQKEPRP